MEHAPADARVWKQELLDGRLDPAVAERAGSVLGVMHQATSGRPDLVERLGDPRVFVQLRVDPFYRRIQERHPDLSAAIAGLVEQLLHVREALCMGDYSPKNILVHGGGFTLVDYEAAYLGDPTMDLGFFLSHLLLKAVRRPEQRGPFADLTRAFWDGYRREARFRPAGELEERAIGHFAVCFLARVDGTSPVDYLPHESQRERVRQLGRRVLRERPTRWEEVLSMGDPA
jgi:5-methylthioribose kinase